MIVLASQSRRRKVILRKMGWPFRVAASAYHERRIPGIPPAELVVRHAVGKVKKSVLSPKTRWILGADTVVVYRGRVLGKPRSRGDAFRMLSALAGKEHRVYTGVALWDRKTGRWRTGVSETRVRIRAMAASAIRDYFSRVDPMDKAGAYGIQEGPRIVEQVDGSYTNVVGLPVELLRRMAAETGMLKGAGPRRVKKTSARSRACRYLPSKARASRG